VNPVSVLLGFVSSESSRLCFLLLHLPVLSLSASPWNLQGCISVCLSIRAPCLPVRRICLADLFLLSRCGVLYGRNSDIIASLVCTCQQEFLNCCRTVQAIKITAILLGGEPNHNITHFYSLFTISHLADHRKKKTEKEGFEPSRRFPDLHP
jgi:hypothetical protein